MPQGSLQHRFLWLALPLLAMLGSIIYYSQHLVSMAAEESIRSVNEIREAEHSISELRGSLLTLEQLAYQSAIISYAEDGSIALRVDEQLERLREQLLIFSNSSLLREAVEESTASSGDQLAAMTSELSNTLLQLQRQIRYYQMVINDNNLRFPVAPILVEKLPPASAEFYDAVNLALDELGTLPDSREVRQIRSMFNELRYNWTQQISWLRLFIANRFGVFGSPQMAARGNLQSRALHVDAVDRLISQLEQLAQQGRLELQSEQSVRQIRQSFILFETHFAEAEQIYTTEEWRVDQQMLSHYLQPLFSQAHGLINNINAQINARITDSIARSQNIAWNISTLIWITGLVLVLLMVAGYLLFEYVIRRPVLQVASAMNAEASGQPFSPLLESGIRETSLLIDAFKHMRQQVHSRQTRLESILDSAAQGIITIDEQGSIESINSAVEKLFGYEAGEIVGRNLDLLLPPKRQQRRAAYPLRNGAFEVFEGERELTGRHKYGDIFPVSFKLSEMRIGGRKLFTAIVDDISERTEMIKNLRRLAEHDSLTGLHNRYYFTHELERLARRAERDPVGHSALLYMDLDNFKFVNDTMGHLAGDRLLVEVANVLQQRTRDADLLARIGGDEFAVILYGVSEEEALKAAESFRVNLQNYHFNYEAKTASIGCSIGIAMVEQGVSNDELLARADFACHAAKRSGRNKIHLYDEVDRQNLANLSDDMGWVRRIKQALEDDLFMFVLQPIQSSNSTTINRYEILLRMLDHAGKFIMPSGFIPPAERFGLMPDIDRWVVNHAFDYLQSGRADDLHLSINLSAASFDNQALLDSITEQIHSSGIDPTRLTFEITETVAMTDLMLTATFMDKLRSLGCRTALDDFGVGYSSFAYLKDLPVDYVKIDGSFVHDIDRNDLNKAIVKSMNDVAQAMGKQTVAEFVESEKIAAILRLMGVDYLQGYHIGEPAVPDFEKSRIKLLQKQAAP